MILIHEGKKELVVRYINIKIYIYIYIQCISTLKSFFVSRMFEYFCQWFLVRTSRTAASVMSGNFRISFALFFVYWQLIFGKTLQ